MTAGVVTFVMNSKNLRILFLAIFGLWFGIIVPGHERGIITVPGFKACDDGQACAAEADRASGAAANCNRCPGEATPNRGESKDSVPTKRERARHCAICQYIGVLGAPLIVSFAPPASQLIGCLPLPAYRSVVGILASDLIRSRGPPASLHFV